MNNIFLKVCFLAGLGLLLTVNTSLGETGFVNRKEFGIQPSFPGPGNISMVRTYIGCYDAFTFKELDCAFTHKVIGLKPPSELSDNNGGHINHSDTHPLIEPRDGSLQFDGVDSDHSKLGIDGQTRNTSVVLTHPIPQAAGKIVTETLITAPFGWRCARECFTENSHKYEYTYDVGVEDLGPLPDGDEHYVKCRSEACPTPLSGASHPEGSHGTQDTTKKLKAIARKYFERTGRKLSINDISLPKGGLFDINNNWATPHIEHRTGTDADLNRCDGSGGFCPTCEFLRDVVQKIAQGQLRPSLKCESEGRKHIDFD